MPGEYDIDRMREEAAQRMRELQARARRPRRESAPPAPEEPPETPVSPEAVPEPQPAPRKVQREAPESALNALFRDKDRTILLTLLLLLDSENGSRELMFALLYLLL